MKYSNLFIAAFWNGLRLGIFSPPDLTTMIIIFMIVGSSAAAAQDYLTTDTGDRLLAAPGDYLLAQLNGPFPVSPDGSIFVAPGPGSITSNDGVWTFGGPTNGGYETRLAGVTNGGAVRLEVLNGGKAYALNSFGTWYVYGGNGWTTTADPHAATPPPPPPAAIVYKQTTTLLDCKGIPPDQRCVAFNAYARTDGIAGLYIEASAPSYNARSIVVHAGSKDIAVCDGKGCNFFWPKTAIPTLTNDVTIILTLQNGTKVRAYTSVTRP